jgi:hypothetical protein
MACFLSEFLSRIVILKLSALSSVEWDSGSVAMRKQLHDSEDRFLPQPSLLPGEKEYGGRTFI